MSLHLESKFHACVEDPHLRIGLVGFIAGLGIHILKTGEGKKVVTCDVEAQTLYFHFVEQDVVWNGVTDFDILQSKEGCVAVVE